MVVATYIVLAANDALPSWVDDVRTVGSVGLLAIGFWMFLTGKLRRESEVTEAKAEAAAWKVVYETEKEARMAAEAAARHVMESGSAVVALVDALRTLKAEKGA